MLPPASTFFLEKKGSKEKRAAQPLLRLSANNRVFAVLTSCYFWVKLEVKINSPIIKRSFFLWKNILGTILFSKIQENVPK